MKYSLWLKVNSLAFITGTFNYKLKKGASLGRPFGAVNGFMALVTGAAAPACSRRPHWGHCYFTSRDNTYIVPIMNAKLLTI